MSVVKRFKFLGTVRCKEASVTMMGSRTDILIHTLHRQGKVSMKKNTFKQELNHYKNLVYLCDN